MAAQDTSSYPRVATRHRCPKYLIHPRPQAEIRVARRSPLRTRVAGAVSLRSATQHHHRLRTPCITSCAAHEMGKQSSASTALRTQRKRGQGVQILQPVHSYAFQWQPDVEDVECKSLGTYRHVDHFDTHVIVAEVSVQPLTKGLALNLQRILHVIHATVHRRRSCKCSEGQHMRSSIFHKKGDSGIQSTCATR